MTLRSRFRLRRHIDAEIQRLTGHARRHDSSLSVIILDLDRFKQVNDTLGHSAGDALLNKVADVLRAECRVGDLLGRWGGDEFVVVCPDADCSAVASLAARISDSLKRADPPVGASIGTASGTDGDALLFAADHALYAAKAAGRGQVRAAGGVLSEP